jgi:hypothetical protein
VKSNTLAIGFVVLAVVFIVVAALYAVGVLQILSSGSGTHIKHAILFAVLAVASLIAANFTREKAV